MEKSVEMGSIVVHCQMKQILSISNYFRRQLYLIMALEKIQLMTTQITLHKQSKLPCQSR